jgi:hypothetical protein
VARVATMSLRTRLKSFSAAERWGYGVWGIGVAVILVPELTAAAGAEDLWPTISSTVGHLESQHSWVALIVVAVVVFVAYHVARLPSPDSSISRRHRPALARTTGGRLTQVRSDVHPVPHAPISGWYVVLSVILVAGPTAAVAAVSGGFYVAYVMYSTIALLFVVVPNVLAYFVPREVPYPTFFRTLEYLRTRAHFLVVFLVIGLVILLIHLALYPWPGIFDKVNPGVHTP